MQCSYNARDSNVYDNIDGGHKTCLIASDISAAFDTIDHRTLLTRTGNMFGVSGSVLLWLESYLSGGSSYVKRGEGQSTVASSSVGVSQGSVLGPNLFSMYIAPIAKIAAAFGVCMHQYADETQLYIEFTAKEGGSKTMVVLKNCNQ